jgi:hypothetical protein
MQTPKEVSDFVLKLKEETRIYTNFSGIMEKAERDGYLQCIHLTLSNIFQQEMKFAVFGHLNRTQEDPRPEPTHHHQEAPGNQPVRLQRKSQTDFPGLQFPNQLTNSSATS